MESVTENNLYERDESFRDSIATITKEGKRAWIYPKKPNGKLYNYRTLVSYIFLAIFFLLPWIKINGHPFMMLNVIERKFVLMSIAFFPQDFFLFVLAMITFVVFIALFTALFGRLWCGWACPQTVFMEMIFRKIEYWIEGDYMQQKALNAQAPNPQKSLKKLAKHSIFFFISFIISNTFLAYIIGIDEWKQIALANPSEHTGGLIAILLFTGVFYGVYARFREQVCLVVCPYGRLQGVLLDPNSVVIGYDYGRGEPRGKLHKGAERTNGDCIDCHQCVSVCPTGIDIRNGTQLECINCTACIDACNSIMDKINKPHGLIRYTSENAIRNKEKFKVTPRIIGYSIVLFVLLSTLITLLAMRSDVETTILRTPGMLYQKQGADSISNLYNIQLVNKTFEEIPVTVKANGQHGTIKWIGNGITKIDEQGIADGEFFFIMPKNEISKTKTKIKFEIWSNGKMIDKTETNFLAPNN
ncbi:MAG TPA: cytochrome c oxidase accessory protein CcoG [Bacteroidia bacterium]|nr:cytochrome c oxidase accessory protein CcoG [Bacteroidia bacterium]HNU34860.1 cytochrome c oxidase accessory protein CcoG [Bacteroidia bacterium]